MTDLPNPYQSPGVSDEPAPALARPRRDRFTVVGWPIVFALNVIVPLMFGWSLTEQSGRAGMFVAMLMVLGAGWCWGPTHSRVARRVIIGSVVTALTQFFPVLHLWIGMFWIMLVGMPTGNDVYSGSGTAPIGSELAGFAVTIGVGSSLILCSGVFGAVLALLLPKRWFGSGMRLAVEST